MRSRGAAVGLLVVGHELPSSLAGGRMRRALAPATSYARTRGRFAIMVAFVNLAVYDALQAVAFLESGRLTDFQLFWTAARAALISGPGSIYAPQPGLSWPYLNPPLLAWLIAPLASLTLRLALGLWLAASLTALAAAPLLSGFGRRGMLSAAAFLPVFVAVGSGQVAPLLLLVVIVAANRERRGDWLQAGLLLALMGVKPQLGLVIPIALLAAGRWRPVLVAGFATALTGVAYIAVLGPSGIEGWVRELSVFGHDAYFLRWSIAAEVGEAGWLVALPLVLAGAAIAARRWAREPVMVMGIAVIGSLLINHYLTPSDLVMLLLPIWAMWHHGMRERVAAVGLWIAGWLALWTPEVLIPAEAAALLALACPSFLERVISRYAVRRDLAAAQA